MDITEIKKTITGNSDNFGETIYYYTQKIPKFINCWELKNQVFFFSGNDFFINKVNSLTANYSKIYNEKGLSFFNPYILIRENGRDKNRYNVPEFFNNINIPFQILNHWLLENLNLPVLKFNKNFIFIYLGEFQRLKVFVIQEVINDSIPVFEKSSLLEKVDYNKYFLGIKRLYDNEIEFIQDQFISFSLKSNENLIDEKLERAVQYIADDLKKSIEHLLANGYEKLVYQSIRNAFNESPILPIEFKQTQRNTALASLVINLNTFCFDIPDYGLFNILKRPLDKAVYRVFLENEQGIIYRENYKQDILDYYLQAGGKIPNAVDRFCDYSDPSFYESISRIKASFLRLMDDDVAKNYYIIKKGNLRTITLPRELVIY